MFGTPELQPPEQPGQVQRVLHQLAVEVLHHLVHVGDGEAHCGGLAVHFGDEGNLGVNEHLVLGGDDLQFVGGKGREVPVLRPGRVVDVAHDVHLAAEVRQIHGADPDVRQLQGALRDLLGAFVDLTRGVPPGVEVLGLGESGRFDQRTDIGPVVRHPDARRRVESLDQHAHFALGIERERPADARASLRSGPAAGCVEQSAGDSPVVPALEEAEKRDALLLRPLLVEVGIDLGGDPACGLSVKQREKAPELAVLEKRALLRVQRAAMVVEQRRHPLRVRFHPQDPGHPQERLQLFVRLYGADLDRHERARNLTQRSVAAARLA